MNCVLLDHIQNKWYENVEIKEWNKENIKKLLNFTQDSILKWTAYGVNIGTKRKPNYMQFCIFYDDCINDPSNAFITFVGYRTALCNSLLIVGFEDDMCRSINKDELNVIRKCMVKKFGRVMFDIKDKQF